MNPLVPSERIRSVLETNRIWCAYALADLDPEYIDQTRWLLSETAVMMIYTGLEPPVLFAYGDSIELEKLFKEVPSGIYQYSFMKGFRAIIANRLQPSVETIMLRMSLKPNEFPPESAQDAFRLDASDLPAVRSLFAHYQDRPDAFQESQLQSGFFFGVWEDQNLISIAGTHVVSTNMGVAAVGNVFTRPDRRASGQATRSTAGVVNALLEAGVRIIVLNVAKDNLPAIRCYRRLGFQPSYEYLEGIGEITN